jgi:hypothetical protein
MPFFSPFLLGIISFIFLSSNKYKQHAYYSPSLLHIPYKLGPLTDCILIYEWFYNSFYYRLNSSSQLFPSITTYSTKRHQKQPVISLHHLLFFIYIFFNILLVYSIHIDILPISYLGVLPAIFLGGCTITHPSPLILLDTLYSSSIVLPSIQPTSSNHDKLYLTAWQSTMNANTKLMKFSSEQAICIDTGASCSISNNKLLPLLLLHPLLF